MREKTIGLFVSDLCPCFQKLEGHNWNYMSFLWKSVRVLSTQKTPHHFPLNIGFVSFWLLVTELLSTTSIRALKIPVSHHVIDMKFHCSFQLMIVRLLGSRRFLIVQCHHDLKLNRIKQFWLVQSFQDHIGRHIACWPWSLIPSYIEILDIVILQSHTDKFAESVYCFIRSGCTEILVNHARNLSSSKEESVGILSSLLFDTCSLSEGRMRVDELLQGWRNHRIKHVEIKKIRLPCNRSRCNKFVNLFRHFNFFDTQHLVPQMSDSQIHFSPKRFHRLKKLRHLH